MLVNLKTGFYSIVHKAPCKKDELLIRAHSKVDMDNLHELLRMQYKFNGKILDTPETDYAYRMIVPKKILTAFMSVAVNDLVNDSYKYTSSWQATDSWQRHLAKGTLGY